MIAIYVVRNSVNDKVYVGQTSLAIELRLRAHRYSPRQDMPIVVAMRELGPANFWIELLQECESQAEANAVEREWIRRLRTLAPAGYNATLGISRSTTQAAKTSRALKGRRITWGAKIAAAMRGRKLGPERLASLRAGRQRWAADPAFSRRRSETNGRRVLTDAMVRDIRDAKGTSQQALADRLGVSQTTVSRALRGVRFGWL